MVRHTTTDDEPTTKSEAVEAVYDELTRRGYGHVDRYNSLNVVKVHDPADPAAMYEAVDEAVPGVIDVRMTGATIYQIDPDPNDRLSDGGA